jgi:ribosomal protein S18 acetylase RimI-like enzyme
MAPRVWLAREEDLESVTALMSGFRDDMGRETPTDSELRSTVAKLLEDPATEFLLGAPEGGQDAAGVCQLRYRLTVWTGADDCWLEDLFVESDARRSGLGRALVGEAFARARARGCRRIDLDVDEDNTRALALYRAMGFSTEPKSPGRTLYVARRL